MAVDGDLFVANGGTDNDVGSVTELDGSTGALVRVISGSAYQFNDPSAMVLDGRACSWPIAEAARSPSSTPRRARW